MKNVLVVALFVACSFVVGCGDGDEPGETGDTTNLGTGMEVDSNAGGGTEVTVGTRTFEFDGTAMSVDPGTRMVTIKHEAIGDYRPASSSQFELADSGMAEYIELNAPVHYTVEVVGDKALITGMETADVDDADDGDEADLAPDAEDTTKK